MEANEKMNRKCRRLADRALDKIEPDALLPAGNLVKEMAREHMEGLEEYRRP